MTTSGHRDALDASRACLFAAFVFAALAALAVATMTRVFEWVDGLAFRAGAGPQLRDEAHLHLELLLDLGKFFGVLGHHGRLSGALRDADIAKEALDGGVLLEHLVDLSECLDVIAHRIVVAAEREQRVVPRVID